MNTSADFVNKLKAWRERRMLSQEDAAKLLGVSRSYLSQLENGREPGIELLVNFKHLELSEQRVNFQQQSQGFSVNAESPPAYPAVPIRGVPLISWASAGEAVSYEELPLDWQATVPTTARDEKAFAITIQGDSMEPKFSAGDRLILLPSVPPRNGCLVVARFRSDGVVFKLFNIVNSTERAFRLTSYNPVYPPLDCREEDFDWIYPVFEVLKNVWR